MEQNNKITISIESASQSKFSKLLIETLQMCDVERNIENQRANLSEESLAQEKKEHVKTKDALQAEKDEHVKTKESLNKLSNYAIAKIKTIFDRIASLLDCPIENKPFADFVKAIIKTNEAGKYLWSDCSDIDSFLYKCKFETSFFSRIASLIWWNEQEELRYMTSCINRIDDIQPLVNSAVAILEVFDHSIKFPTGPMAETMYEYTSYVNEPSNFIRIFSSEKMANNTLCEVRQLAIDGQEGEMFIYYK